MASGGIAATGGPLVFHYWKNPGGFNNGLKGICASFIQAAFSFGGGDYIAIIAPEVKEPRETVRATIGPLFWRMASFFVLNIWLVGMVVPYNDVDLINKSGTLASPFVIAIKRAGIMPLAHVLNALIFLTVLSCGITSIYIASRCLSGLSELKLIHPLFDKKDKAGRPYLALIVSTTLGGGLCYLNCNNTAAVVGIAGFIQYALVYNNLIRFRMGLKAQGIHYKKLSFYSRCAPYLQYIGLVFIFLILAAEFYLSIFPFGAKPSASNFFASYLAAPLFIFDYFAYKWWFKTKIVKPIDMDFSAAAYFDYEEQCKAEETMANPPPKLSLWKKVLAKVIG
ncbi:hypothetical protein BP6252_07461 [Coleophoma cylindrospora]|uniref:Amino acid permease/ SLC12A domain-containing protein n=1 Tax=Coleophoma cylindrospora TaxID=1849047 RepID=A0A3D8RI38_9HELO|nr:hypothetical protein BP6252_07461 [Coleophoma cylindrospora]